MPEERLDRRKGPEKIPSLTIHKYYARITYKRWSEEVTDAKAAKTEELLPGRRDDQAGSAGSGDENGNGDCPESTGAGFG
jgi:hypothetical protein